MWIREGAAHPLPERGLLGAGLPEGGGEGGQGEGRALVQDWSLGLPGVQKPLPGPVVSGGARAERQ